MVALDPRFEEAYSWSSLAMQSVSMKMTNADYYAVLAIIERGMKEFPENWKLPLRAGEIYARGLTTDEWHSAWWWGGWWDQVWKYAWKAEGAMLLSRAVRLPPSAPPWARVARLAARAPKLAPNSDPTA
jgi:hypothetical protein